MPLTNLVKLELLINKEDLREVPRKRFEDLLTSIKNSSNISDNTNVHISNQPRQLILFYGSDLFDKTTMAAMVGKELNKEVHKVELAQIVGKYIGETEKNVQALFKAAEDKNWILFFDEADALFGKRTDVKDAHDRYANVEISYLLQTLEKYKGILILTSSADTIDEKWLTYFKSTVHFPKRKFPGL